MKRGYIKHVSKVYEHALQKPKIIHIIILAAISLVVVLAAPIVQAVNYNAEINKLRDQNNAAKAQQQDLAVSAQNLSERIAGLQAEIAAIEGQIQENRAKDARLQADIAKAEAELVQQKKVLGENIKAMYVDDGMSTIEMLATSKTLGEFVDQKQYKTAVQNKITNTMARIEAIKKQLDKQKAEVQKLLEDQQAMQANLATQKAESDRLLSLNQQQQHELNQSMQANNAKISELQRLQAIENAKYNIGKVAVGGTGGYPWANVPFPNSMPDPWGMYKRQCVSYTAWKVASSGRYMPYWGGRGNAKLWDDNARAAGIPVDTNPRVGDVAISNAGTYGHAMYVEAVHGDGTITVSQYNASWDGQYSVAKRSVTGLVFIHF